ncbi:23S rRNA (guanosine(2251)-2'-O)-methyltransferase RlmB [Irregularibacter muris]
MVMKKESRHKNKQKQDNEQKDISNQIEGRNPVIEALRAARPMEKIMVAKGELTGSIKEIIGIAKEERIVIQYVDRHKLDEMSQSHAHQGVIAITSAHGYVEVTDMIEDAKAKGEAPFLIVLDEITDPHNLGSILRTADACGAHGVIVSKRRAVGLTPVVAKSSAGAIEYVPVAKVTNISQTIDLLKEEGFWVAGAEMSGQQYYYEADLKGPMALVIGSEGKGLGRLVKEKCDFLLKIPMVGQVSSLNAAVAGAILMYEVRRQRNQG